MTVLAVTAPVRDPIRIRCGWCGSVNVSRDAWAAWDVGAQCWTLQQVFDDGFCHACEGRRGLEEVGYGMMTWSEAVEAAVRRRVAKTGDGSFTRQALIDEELDQIVADCGSTGVTPHQTLSRELQSLRERGRIVFVDDRGSYRWLA